MNCKFLHLILLWCLWTPVLYPQALPSSQPGVIMGTIRRADGTPAVDVRVAAASANGVATGTVGTQALDSIVQTDAAGRYRLEGLPAGLYYVLAGTLDYPSYYPGVITLPDARAVTVTAGATIGSIDLTLPRPLAVRGRVTGVPAGAPSDLFAVVLLPTRAGAPLLSTVKVDGAFEFTDVPPGTYNVNTNPRALLPVGRASLGGVPGGASVPHFNSIEVSDRDLRDLEVALPPLIAGRVDVDDGSRLPIEQAAVAPGTPAQSEVRIHAAREWTTPIAVARSDGWFAISAPAGEYTAAVNLPFGYSVKSIRQDSRDLTHGPLIVAEMNPALVQVTLTRTPRLNALPTFTVAGRVDEITASAAQPMMLALSGVSRAADGLNSIYGIAAENRMGEVSARPDGSFEFHGVPPGLYDLSGSGLKTVTVTVTVGDVRGIKVVPFQPVPQQSSSRLPSIDSTIRVKVSGKVTRLPANSALIRNPQIRLGSLQTSMNPDGSFEFSNVAPGTYDLTWTGIDVAPYPVSELMILQMTLPPLVVVGDHDVTGVTLELPISVLTRVTVSGDGNVLGPSVNWEYRMIAPGDSRGTTTAVLNPGVYAIIPRVPAGYRLRSLTVAGVDVLKMGLWLDRSSSVVELLFTLEPIP